jgi:uncharacterized protein (DUF2249 family)/iron-sulfur cluster repair protein YtfE (RIC family)
MSEISDAFQNHHQAILSTVAAHVAAIAEAAPHADPRALVTFLQGDLLPHAAGEERYLYPALDPVLKRHGRPTDTMTVDHEFIERYIQQIAETVGALSIAEPVDPPALQTRLQRLCWQLQALLELHLEKEERIYMPLFERYVADEEQQRILEGMHEPPLNESARPHPTVLDLRTLLPAQRHKWIFDSFEDLEAGEHFVIVGDQNLRPLFYEFQAAWGDGFTWEDLDDGPARWRARLGRPGAAANGIEPGLIILVE